MVITTHLFLVRFNCTTTRAHYKKATEMPDAAMKRPAFDLSEVKQKLFEALLESESVGFGLCDSDLRVVLVNKAWSKMDGVAPEDHVGKTVPEILGVQSCPVEAAMRHVLRTGEKIEGLKFGAKIPARTEVAEWVVNLYRLEVGGEPYVFSLTIDTTARAAFDAYLALGRHDRSNLLPNTESPGDKSIPLSNREIQVVRFLAKGKSNKEIAAILGLSQKTVEYYRGQIFRTLNIHSLADLVLYAVGKRIIVVKNY